MGGRGQQGQAQDLWHGWQGQAGMGRPQHFHSLNRQVKDHLKTINDFRPRVRKSDRGIFACVATNKVAKSEAKAVLKVKCE